MAKELEDDNKGRARRVGKAAWAGVAAIILLPLVALFAAVATDDDENIVLSRNEVVQAAAGGRVWRGTFWNHTDSLYTKLDAVILFLDAEGRPVGQARGASARLDPGETFHLHAPLPAEARRIQMYQLRWTTGDTSVALGPWQPWPFGYVQDSECGELGLKIGSCTPVRDPG